MKGARGGIAALALLAVVACARGPVLEGGAFRDPTRGWSIAAPPAEWSVAHVKGADLTLRGPRGARMSLQVRCGVALAAPEVLARDLRIGIAASGLRDQREVSIDGRPAWVQVFDVAPGESESAVGVRVKAVTRTGARCVEDFVLVASGDWSALEPAFDAWWASFRAGPETASAAQ